MKIQKTTCAVLVAMTVAVESAFAQFVLTPIPDLPSVASGSVAWADYDNDGRLDFLLSGSVELSLWRNTAGGFTNVTTALAPDLPGLYDSAVAWGDFDNDQRLDLLITGLTNLSGRAEVSQLWRNTGDGFTQSLVPGLPGVAQSSAAWSDFDGDGRLDFLITGTSNGTSIGAISQLWRNTGGGFTNVPIPGLPGVYFGSMAWADFDNDARPDFLITGITNGSESGSTAQLWRNTGSGFTNMPVPGLPGVFVSSLGWADYDNDGKVDFLLDGLSANGFVSQLWRNTGEGFINVPVPGLQGIGDGSLAWADYDSNGWRDFLITGLAGGATPVAQIWRNTGNGFTNVPMPGLPGNFDNSLAWGDYDNDGRPDFLIAGTIEGGMVSQLWRNTFTSPAPEVSVPDPGLNAAIRQILQKPAGALTEQDMLSLTNLDASRRNVSSIAGLEAARNLVSLDLQVNRLTNFSLPRGLTKLTLLNVSSNPLTNCTLPDGLTNLSILTLAGNGLTHFSLPAGLTGLNSLSLENNQLSTLSALSNLTGLVFLDLSFNAFTNFSLPRELTNLSQFIFDGNLLTNLTLPEGMKSLAELHLSQNQLTTFTLPGGLTNLTVLNLFFNELTNLTLPDDQMNLAALDLDFNRLTRLNLPSQLGSLRTLKLRSNQFTDFNLPAEWTQLRFLDIGENRLTNVRLPAGLNQLEFLRLSGNTNLTTLTLPVGLTNLTGLFLRFNQLTNLTLPSDLANLVQIDVLGNRLASLSLPAGLTNLITLVLSGNQLTNVTLPSDLTKLSTLVLEGNPLSTLVLSDPLAVTNLAESVASLREQGISVLTYPLVPQLVRPRDFVGRFQFGITGPPGLYTILGSINLADWEVVGTANNALGSINFNDLTTNLVHHQFYRVVLQPPPTNMVFIPANTFLMGSPAGELHRQANEGPQTTVTLTRGFWIGKYEVTQGEYLSLMSTNPSQFPGDLSRPISSVSWPDATNYCWNLTQRELAAGRISPGSQYRLPTEAEWECAARAGTTTRFSYGDDPDYSSLMNYAWQTVDDGLTVHPVGQKLPNPWGLYNTMGNVFEWCQNWLGPLPGGEVTDPTGPDSNPIGWKIMRGGAFDYGAGACRSANRLFFANHPALTDWNLGFRVVLVTGPQ
jgi:formylglycine-generating enzyme required for sulfatase activity